MKFKTVNEYIDSLPEETKPVIKSLRKIIKEEIPDSEEVMSYNIPCYKVNDKQADYFSAVKS